MYIPWEFVRRPFYDSFPKPVLHLYLVSTTRRMKYCIIWKMFGYLRRIMPGIEHRNIEILRLSISFVVYRYCIIYVSRTQSRSTHILVGTRGSYAVYTHTGCIRRTTCRTRFSFDTRNNLIPGTRTYVCCSNYIRIYTRYVMVHIWYTIPVTIWFRALVHTYVVVIMDIYLLRRMVHIWYTIPVTTWFRALVYTYVVVTIYGYTSIPISSYGTHMVYDTGTRHNLIPGTRIYVCCSNYIRIYTYYVVWCTYGIRYPSQFDSGYVLVYTYVVVILYGYIPVTSYGTHRV